VGILDGRAAFVTGAGQGLGRGIARALASAGAQVTVTGRTLGSCEAVAAGILDAGGAAQAVRCDVSVRSDVDAAVTAAVDRWGRLDILVNSAQTIAYGALRRVTDADADVQWQSGPMGTLRCMQACFEHLRATHGAIVNVGSGSGLAPAPGMGVYAMTKEAIRTLTRTAALEWGRHGIRVNAICPLADTPGFGAFAKQMPGAVDEQVLPRVPLGRLGDPEVDIGRAVVFLVGPDGGYVTGTTLMLDGGYSYLR
jgi:NAD(P)-dependent dehydrogenase (short-subunit alcohol dehydrogenase family)